MKFRLSARIEFLFIHPPSCFLANLIQPEQGILSACFFLGLMSGEDSIK
jgi:hypothetical protein